MQEHFTYDEEIFVGIANSNYKELCETTGLKGFQDIPESIEDISIALQNWSVP